MKRLMNMSLDINIMIQRWKWLKSQMSGGSLLLVKAQIRDEDAHTALQLKHLDQRTSLKSSVAIGPALIQ